MTEEIWAMDFDWPKVLRKAETMTVRDSEHLKCTSIPATGYSHFLSRTLAEHSHFENQ